ncbi:usg protein [Curvivirga aplysinae]|uniref:usg protein n=1 Tax=Curvivirga aplysinae TaxID=2529852 RepID=UPI0012BB633A|nr:Usg family protein [Curvivirga aplysinae]MTI09117.1 Usg family protein [Curvivirga aplysinae]
MTGPNQPKAPTSNSIQSAPSELELQLKGYRLATAEFLYHMPDHPTILQSFIWQTYDLLPEYPEIHKFIDFWEENIDGPLHSVHVASCDLLTPGDARFADVIYQIH